MSDRPTRICIGVPCYGQVAPEVLQDWCRWLYHCGRRLTQYDFLLAIKTKTEQFRARNAIVEAAMQGNADYLLMLDDDMILDVDDTSQVNTAYDLIDRLVQHQKDVCGVLYFQRGGECRPVLMEENQPGKYRFLRDDEITHGLQRVDVAGGGCLLIDMKVFNRIDQPWFAPEHLLGTDIQLCAAAKAKGFEVWADTSIELGHLKSERSLVTSRTRHQHQMADTVPGDVQQQFVASDIYATLEADATEYTGWTKQEMDDRSGWFMREWKDRTGSLLDWYQQFPKDRVARQVWFNSTPQKRAMTQFLLSQVNPKTSLRILDFGCGIGIPAFALAQQGHRVTACDLSGTGTFEFLQWRAKQHKVDMTFYESDGGIPHLGGAQFDLIIAMDCLEHIPEWKATLRYLSDRLTPNGVLFANNAILDDPNHPEHIDLIPEDFVAACAQLGLMPTGNQIMYVKRVRASAAA